MESNNKAQELLHFLLYGRHRVGGRGGRRRPDGTFLAWAGSGVPDSPFDDASLRWTETRNIALGKSAQRRIHASCDLVFRHALQRGRVSLAGGDLAHMLDTTLGCV